MKIPISLDDFFSTTLKCPTCNEINLHHTSITVYSRSDDEEETFRTIVGHKGNVTDIVKSRGCGNPSSRRHGLTIMFYCEHCGDGIDYVLCIAQHKGQTDIYWLGG